VQDFLLTNFPAFIARSPEDFLKFMLARKALAQAAASGSSELPALLKRFNDDFPNVERARTNIGNPLAVSYFSQTPYALGAAGLAVKYRTQAQEPDTDCPPSEQEAKKRSGTYLREAMAKRLDPAKGKPVVFDFQVQRRDEGMEIEDPTQEWSEQRSAFVTVATLVIPPQEFLVPQMDLAEHISFNPWNGLKAHQPLGRVNEARRTVYHASATFRHSANGISDPAGAPAR
jgi:hypothetical protein